MSDEGFSTAISPLEKARKAGAAARAQNEREDMLGILLFGVGLLGLFATVWLTAEVDAGNASPYVWEAIITPLSRVWWMQAIAVLAYLLSYFFIGGIASTVVYNCLDPKVGPLENFICSMWFLGTVLWLARPLIKSFETFWSYLPSDWIGWGIFLLWSAAAFLVFLILNHPMRGRRSRRGTH